MKSLGFQLHIEALEQSPYIDELLSIKDPNLTTVKLIDSKGFIIELLKFDNYQVEETWSGDLKTTGLTHIALTVDNLDLLVDNLKKQNYQLLSNTFLKLLIHMSLLLTTETQNISLYLQTFLLQKNHNYHNIEKKDLYLY